MKIALRKLLESIGLCCDFDIEITGIESDSRRIKDGNLFVAISGHETDGHSFIDTAIKKGAIAVVGDKDLKYLPVPYFKVQNSRETVCKLAHIYYQTPHHKHKMVGITGTDGKTTTAYILHHILTYNGKSASMLGTVEYYINGARHQSTLTTPDPILLQKLIHDSHDEYVVMEVSSHGLEQYRVAGPMFDYALFTNLSHEHLDYHSDLEHYYQAKKKLFKCLKKNGKGIIGAYTPWGERMHEELSAELVPTISYGHSKKNEPIFLKSYNSAPNSVMFVNDYGTEYIIHLNIPGKHNILNAFGSYLCARDMGFSPEQIIKALETFEGVPGRFEEMSTPNGAKVIIDYAHTPDGLYHALKTANECVDRGLYHIFGFRGKRDKTKRKEMIELSHSLSKHVYLTLDDLNGIQKEQMLIELYALSESYPNVTVIEDRTKTIETVLRSLKSGEGVIITGKGPEKYKEVFLHKTVSDKETVLKILKESTFEPLGEYG